MKPNKNKRLEIINKSDTMKCWSCDGEGSVIINEAHPLVRRQCDVCDGTGQWVEQHYIIIDNKNKIAIDSDNGS
jgi:DnaJ-class molecular chaperone